MTWVLLLEMSEHHQNYRGAEFHCAGDEHFASTLKKIHTVCEGMTAMIHAMVLANGASISAFPPSFSRLLQWRACQRNQEHILLGFQESDTVPYSCYHSGIFMRPVPSCCAVIWALVPPDHMDWKVQIKSACHCCCYVVIQYASPCCSPSCVRCLVTGRNNSPSKNVVRWSFAESLKGLTLTTDQRIF